MAYPKKEHTTDEYIQLAEGETKIGGELERGLVYAALAIARALQDIKAQLIEINRKSTGGW